MIDVELVKKAWVQCEGTCNCTRPSHNHYLIRCGRRLVWHERGDFNAPGGWEIYHHKGKNRDSPGYYEILCSECYRLVMSGKDAIAVTRRRVQYRKT